MESARDVVQEVIEEEEEEVQNYKSGTEEALMYLVGCVLQKSGGRVDPTNARDLLDEEIQAKREIQIPYECRYKSQEVISETDLPDTQSARETFRYTPQAHLTLSWDSGTQVIEPTRLAMNGATYELNEVETEE